MNKKESCCFLCGKSETTLSHILPKCLTKKFRKEANYKFMQAGFTAWRQDLSKHYLLCKNCEEMFSKYERKFYQTTYKDIINGKDEICINNETRYFVLSLLWRIMYECVYKFDKGNLDKKRIDFIKAKINDYKTILLNEDFEKLKGVILSIIPIKWLDISTQKNFPFDKLVKYQIRESYGSGLFVCCLASNIIFVVNLEKDFIHNNYNISKANSISKKDSVFKIGEIEIILDEITEMYKIKNN